MRVTSSRSPFAVTASARAALSKSAKGASAVPLSSMKKPMPSPSVLPEASKVVTFTKARGAVLGNLPAASKAVGSKREREKRNNLNMQFFNVIVSIG